MGLNSWQGSSDRWPYPRARRRKWQPGPLRWSTSRRLRRLLRLALSDSWLSQQQHLLPPLNLPRLRPKPQHRHGKVLQFEVRSRRSLAPGVSSSGEDS